MRSIYLFIGENKDASGELRRAIVEKAESFGIKAVSSPENADAIVVLGGDGTILRATPIALEYDIPVIGFNLGRVGYMAELDATDDELITELFRGNYTEEKRMTLSVSVGDKTFTALNDAVLHSHSTHMIRLCLGCDGNPVGTYRGDGLIFATPTGSTAYSMSAGGPVIDPTIECIEMTPICTQALMSKTLVFAPGSILSVDFDSNDCILTIDGGESVELLPDTAVRISRGEGSLRMIKLKSDGFYGVLRRKFSE